MYRKTDTTFTRLSNDTRRKINSRHLLLLNLNMSAKCNFLKMLSLFKIMIFQTKNVFHWVATFVLARNYQTIRVVKIFNCSLERKGKGRDRVCIRSGACRQKYGLNPLAVYPITLLSASNPLDSIPFC